MRSRVLRLWLVAVNHPFLHNVFPMICGSGGSKCRLAKAAGAEPSGQMRDDKMHAAVARSLEVNMVKALQARSAFGS